MFQGWKRASKGSWLSKVTMRYKAGLSLGAKFNSEDLKKKTFLHCFGLTALQIRGATLFISIFRCNPLKGCISGNRIFTHLLTQGL